MKIFLSWSGSRSKAVAETLGDWLSQVIQVVVPWVSSGIDKGARWQDEIIGKLEEAKVGIVCLTSSNLTAPWILFEAGALSKTKDSFVCTFLLDIKQSDIEPPLGQFQHTVFDKADVHKLVVSVNKITASSGEHSLTEKTLSAVFEKFWPDLEAKLTSIAAAKEDKPAKRTQEEMLEEVLEILRSQQRAQRATLVRKLMMQSTKPKTIAFDPSALAQLLEKQIEPTGPIGQTGPTGPTLDELMERMRELQGPTGPTGPTGY